MAPSGTDLVQVEGDPRLIERLRDPLLRALGERRTVYHVRIEQLGRAGEVLVSITGSKGRLPLLFRAGEELEPARVLRVVTDTVDRVGF